MTVLVGADMVERRVEVVARLKALEESAAPLVAFLQNPEAVQELRADKQYNLQMLSERYQVTFSFDSLCSFNTCFFCGFIVCWRNTSVSTYLRKNGIA